MVIGPGKTKLINNPNDFQRDIKIQGHRLQALENVQYLGLMKDRNPRFFSDNSCAFLTDDHMEGQEHAAYF